MKTTVSDGTRQLIQEMSEDGVKGLVKLDPALVKSVVGDDPDPMFVTLNVLKEGVSTNKRHYDGAALQEVCDQINSQHPDGYAGHITPEQRKSVVPDAEVFWLGARIVEVDGVAHLFAKGYVLPEAKKRRDYLRKAKAIGKNVSVSIYGTAKAVFDRSLNAYRQLDIDLESIDFTRPKSEGVRNIGEFALTAEMHDESNVNNEEREAMNKVEALKTASLEEAREHLPAEVIAEMTAEAVEAAQAETRTVVSEMADVTALLGTEKPAVEVIAEMRETNRRLELNQELAKSVVDSKARKMIERMVISEMTDEETPAQAVSRVLDTEEGKAIVAEMTEVEPTVQPKIEQPAAQAQRRFTVKRK